MNIDIKIRTKDEYDYVLSATENNTVSSLNLKTDTIVYVKINNKNKNKHICIGGIICDNIKNENKEFNEFT